MGSPNPIGFGPVLVMAFLLGACRALPPGGSNWVVQSRSCLLAPEQTQVPHRPQVPRRRVNNFQLANVMEPQSSPPAPTPAPAPGSDADILVDDSVSNAPATFPASVAATSAMTNSQETKESSFVATSKKRKLTSQVWDHFEKIIQDKCIVKHGGLGSSRQSQIDFSSGLQAVWVFSQEVTQKKIAEMIILHKYPFAMVEHQGFRDMMASSQPSLVIPRRKTLRNDCIGLYNLIKEIKMAQLTHASYIALTTNLWTSTNLMGYMVVTAHYVAKDWNLNKLIISFKPLPSPHTGQAIADCLSQTLIEWKVLLKLSFITLDNGSSNNLAVTRLKRFVTDQTCNANP
ncbi:hypothetical protein PCASD_06274 [Puccinia coronata f. sp. avenae]|uniref:HAT C-terminal dimerisation domain-containing protein n=1 Tax=Puccinia coronata f. sp. avenae TaxID=200324 RepID=A0A2N5V6G3_9BASI|nr:hypothetical protein PCASD_06274 [Puccinia coronata f. sp. avenae]